MHNLPNSNITFLNDGSKSRVTFSCRVWYYCPVYPKQLCTWQPEVLTCCQLPTCVQYAGKGVLPERSEVEDSYITPSAIFSLVRRALLHYAFFCARFSLPPNASFVPGVVGCYFGYHAIPNIPEYILVMVLPRFNTGRTWEFLCLEGKCRLLPPIATAAPAPPKQPRFTGYRFSEEVPHYYH